MTSLVNLSSFVAPVSIIPIVPPDFIYCNRAYGTRLPLDEALNAVTQLPRGTSPVTYAVEELDTELLAANVSALGVGHELPFLILNSHLALSVDVSGPLDIDSIRVVPDDIREMATWVASECIARGGGVGGFVTRGIRTLVDFVLDPTADIDDIPYPDDAGFLTLLISNHESSATFPGDHDPAVADVLKTAEIAAYLGAPPRYRSLFAERVEKFTHSESNMHRLGQVTWWDGWLQGNRTAVTNVQRANRTTESVATARRRKRIAGL